jgi:hypothetical protein
LSEEKKRQILALGRLGWSLRRIEQAVHIRRETASAYLKAAGIAGLPPGGWGHSTVCALIARLASVWVRNVLVLYFERLCAEIYEDKVLLVT